MPVKKSLLIINLPVAPRLIEKLPATDKEQSKGQYTR
jgi:hypothetical protein